MARLFCHGRAVLHLTRGETEIRLMEDSTALYAFRTDGRRGPWRTLPGVPLAVRKDRRAFLDLMRSRGFTGGACYTDEHGRAVTD